MSGRKVDLAIWVREADLPKTAARDGQPQGGDGAGTSASTAANMTSTCSTSSPSATSTWARWRTRASTSSTRATSSPIHDTATDADFDNIAAGRRARIFPQLVGRPGHLPRLVPAEPEGRLHGLPRPELLGRHGQQVGQADRGRAHAARRSSSRRIRGRWRIRCGPTAISRFRTSTRRPSTTRAPS